MKNLILFIACLVLVSCAPKNESKDKIYIREYLERLENSKKYTLEVAELMPEENYNFKANDGSLSFAENLLHIGFAMNWHSKSLLNEQKTKSWQEDVVFKVSKKSKKEMIALIEKTFNEAITLVSKYDVKKLDEKLEYFGLQRSKRQILMLLSDHITHHRAQMIVYLRLNNIMPPRYVLYQ